MRQKPCSAPACIFREEEEHKDVYKRQAKKIREDSEVLVVAGIGGSYLGARAVIELSLIHIS